MVDIEVQTQSQVIQADSEGEADPTYSPSYLSGDDDIYLDDETLASFMSKKKQRQVCNLQVMKIMSSQTKIRGTQRS